MTQNDQERWDARWTARDNAPLSDPTPWIVSLSLPTSGKALDIGAGSGRHALWMATQGLDVTAVDVSPIALKRAQREAVSRGLRLQTVRADLDVDPPPVGPWDVVLFSHFLHRPLLARAVDLLAPGGKLIVHHPTRTNLERHARPSARFLLDDGELPLLVSGLEVVHHSEAWRDNGRYEARFIAIKLT